MPYIITTRPAAEPPNERHAVRARILSRHAVATLEEARDAIYDDARPMMCDRCERPGAPWSFSDHASGLLFPKGASCQCSDGPENPMPAAGPDRADYLDVRALFSLPESGGTVGPLPDGTVIEVAHVGWSDLAAELPDGVLSQLWQQYAASVSGRVIIDAFNARETRA